MKRALKALAGLAFIHFLMCVVELVEMFRLGEQEDLDAWAQSRFTERGIEVDDAD